MKNTIPLLFLGLALGCAPAQQETASADSTVLAPDTTTTSDEVDTSINEDAALQDADPGNVFVIEGGYNYISDPFEFSLDSATLQEMLGEDAVITSQSFPGGEDELGTYGAYSYYELAATGVKMSFYSYSGKHFADVDTSSVKFRNGVVVGMSKDEFIKAMSLPEEALEKDLFKIFDDYGQMSFTFVDNKLINVYVSYEEGD